MLGHISMWLRLLGYDTLFEIDADDTYLLELAMKTERILITRDVELSKRAKQRNIKVILLDNISHERQIAIIINELNLRRFPDPEHSRCVHCNGILEKVKKEYVLNRVPSKVYEYHDTFWVCTSCNQVYYVGKHWKNIMKFFESVNYILKNEL